MFFILTKLRKKNYENIYSSKKRMGGGVANDLSHEIDYCSGYLVTSKRYLRKNKISNLKITSDDTFILIAKIKNILANINLNFHLFLIVEN